MIIYCPPVFGISILQEIRLLVESIVRGAIADFRGDDDRVGLIILRFLWF